MANNYLYSGDVLDYANGGSTEISSGAPVLVGSRRALTLGLKNAGGERRYTHLNYRLRELFNV